MNLIMLLLPLKIALTTSLNMWLKQPEKTLTISPVKSISTHKISKNNWQERPDFGKYFQHAGVNGTFLLYNLKQDKYLAYNPKRANTPFVPASTFKIFNSLVALETSVIRDENEVIKWDGVKRDFPEWNKDQTMRTAIKGSAIWFYQELARRIGEERMQHYINLVNYGNRDISGGIDRFWLDGELRTTAPQQIDFLVKLYQNQLPFSQRSIDIVKDMIINEKTDNYVLRGKTGWAREVTPQRGWYVGYLERGNDVYFFALNLDVVKPSDIKARLEITKSTLRDMDLI
jgi:beta-lactamase class D